MSDYDRSLKNICYEGEKQMSTKSLNELKLLNIIFSILFITRRYTDDVHYAGGAPYGLGLLSWSSFMFSLGALPPPPRHWDTRQEWLAAWRDRLNHTSKSWCATWTHNQLPGPFWEQGSIAQDYERVKLPVLVIGGLEDFYTTAAERMLGNWLM